VSDRTIPPSPCPCATVVHPWVIFNPSNQPTIDYRVGDYAAFRDALLRALPGETELTQTVNGQVIQIWHPGAEGDLAVQMMEWWAYLSDVLTFYNERVATQAYLGVADLPESVNRLIQLLGYRPRPGIGASGTLAALLNTAKPVTLPQGFHTARSADRTAALARWQDGLARRQDRRDQARRATATGQRRCGHRRRHHRLRLVHRASGATAE